MMKKMKHKLKSSNKKNEEKLFLDNGSIFMEKLIADCNGNSIPMRNFFSYQILKATKNFDSSHLVNNLWGHGEWYKGIIDDKPYLIKKFSKNEDDEDYEDVFNDIVLSARMSNHNNFLKLLGCCFEFSSPVVLFEYAEYKFLNGEGRIKINEKESKVLPLSIRLKISKEVAVAVTYLHTAFPRITIHKNINPSNIILDKNWKVKLIDFRLSVTLPEGKSKIQDENFETSSKGLVYFDPLFFHPSHLQTISGAYGYTDPLYLVTRSLSEYIDVYSFGVCLLVFITGRKAHDFMDHANEGMISYMDGFYENGKLNDEVNDHQIAKDITYSKILQVRALVKLALRCCEKREERQTKDDPSC